VRLRIAGFTEKDEADLAFARPRCGRMRFPSCTAEDVKKVRYGWNASTGRFAAAHCQAEKPEAVDNLGTILKMWMA
jgi:pyruvate kinase